MLEDDFIGIPDIFPNEDGYLLSGYIHPLFPNYESLAFFAQMDESGDIIWQKSWQDTQISSGLQDDNNKIWGIAHTFETVSHGILLRLSEDGELELTKDYTHADVERSLYFTDMISIPNKGIVISGLHRTEGGSSEKQSFVMLVDEAGEPQWAIAIGVPFRHPNNFTLMLADDGNIILFESKRVEMSSTEPEGLITKIDPNTGNIIWSRFISAADIPDRYFSYVEMDDEGFIVGVGGNVVSGKGIMFRLDDPLFDSPSCCTEKVELVSMPDNIIVQNISFESGPSIERVSVDVIQEPTVIIKESTCQQEFSPQITFSSEVICPGACVHISLAEADGQDLNWEFPGGSPANFSGPGPIEVCYENSGQYPVLLNAEDGCRRAKSTVLVLDAVPVEFTLSDSVVCAGSCVELLDIEIPLGQPYFWIFNGSDLDTIFDVMPTEICYENAGEFDVELWVGGCLQQAKPLRVACHPTDVPNVFTPNGDGVNDTFFPFICCGLADYSMKIYDRWGNLVFKSNSLIPGWDGMVKSKAAASDVYIWKMEWSETQKGVMTKKSMTGDVTLLR